MIAVLYHVAISDDPLVWVPAWLTLALLLAAAVFGYLQIGEARAARAEARAAVEAQARPYVTIDFDYEDRGLLKLAVENLGKSVASNVSFTFAPPLDSTMTEIAERTRAFFSREWPTLVPGKRVTTVFDSTVARLGEGCELASRYEVVVSYKAPVLRDKVFSETYVLDIESLRGRSYTPTSGIPEAIDKLTAQLKSWNHHSSLSVLTKSRDESDDEYRAAIEEAFRRQRAAAPTDQQESDDGEHQ